MTAESSRIKDMNRRESLSISALLNEVHVEPLGRRKSSSSNEDEGITKTKTTRKRISREQLERLLQVFEETDTPSSEIRENLAIELGMKKREVQVWFQNKRAKVNRAENLVNPRNKRSGSIGSIKMKRQNSNQGYQKRPSNYNEIQYSSNHTIPTFLPNPVKLPSPNDLGFFQSVPPLQQPRITSTFNFQSHKLNHCPIDLLASAAEYISQDDKSNLSFKKK